MSPTLMSPALMSRRHGPSGLGKEMRTRVASGVTPDM